MKRQDHPKHNPGGEGWEGTVSSSGWSLYRRHGLRSIPTYPWSLDYRHKSNRKNYSERNIPEVTCCDTTKLSSKVSLTKLPHVCIFFIMMFLKDALQFGCETFSSSSMIPGKSHDDFVLPKLAPCR